MESIVKEILAKESLSDTDINILMNNKALLNHADLARLGLVPVTVVEQVVETPKDEPVVKKKTRGRKKSV
jgi:hypothetical protein